MTNHLIKLTFLILFSLSFSCGAEEIRISEKTFTEISSDLFSVNGRDGSGSGQSVRLIHFQKDLRPDFEFTLTFYAVNPANLLGSERLRTDAQEGCRVGAQAGDSIPQVEAIPSVAVGFQCTFSDPNLPSTKQVPPGEFRFRTIGTIEADGYVVIITAYHNSKVDPLYNEFLSVLGMVSKSHKTILSNKPIQVQSPN